MNPFDINPVFSEEKPLCNMCPFREPANEIQVMFQSWLRVFEMYFQNSTDI